MLELIQNADDNDYPGEVSSGSGVGPSVKFVVEEKCISVMNNECGFQEKNIRAICDVGKSTKGKHKFGYIGKVWNCLLSSFLQMLGHQLGTLVPLHVCISGQKGIGFKSVFRITDAPEIHSNDYHFKFDLTSDPMGYILPHWWPDTSDKSLSDR